MRGRRYMGKSLYLPLNFAVNLKLLQNNNKVLKKYHTYTQTVQIICMCVYIYV